MVTTIVLTMAMIMIIIKDSLAQSHSHGNWPKKQNNICNSEILLLLSLIL